mmetsp:Transcript_1866/g.4015  ORF Transcript_1866/g.4015 Transcript_1866/m.4015 type:complete len:539 (+) Transcript_1866:187-1803(+)
MDYEEGQGRRRSSASRSSDAGGGSERRKKSASERKKKKPTNAEDALEAKMAAKKKKEMKSSKMEDALEAKIRKKNEKAAAAASAPPSRRGLEEEKVEEDRPYESYDEDDDDVVDEEVGYNHSSRVASAPPTTEENALFTRGGGDVRNRPPPNPLDNSAVLDPLREAQLEKERNKKNVNQRFADMHETGQWGGLSKWEKYGICFLTLGAIVAAVVLGIMFSGGGEKTLEPTMQPTKEPTGSPSTSPTLAPTDTEYRETTGLEMMRAASPKLALPQTPEELVGAKENSDSTPQELAAEFVLYDDPLEIPTRDLRFMERYALSVFYYQNGGCIGDWITKSNWRSDEDHCDNWHGIVCDLKKRVIEVNLSKNYVTGKIPIEFSQLMELSTLDLSNNAMVGTVPADALSMGKMYTIQLNNNLLEGEFPFQEVKEGATILDNLWIQENTQLTGTITESYCAMNSITLDCDNFEPKPVYPIDSDSGLTTFQTNCLDSKIGRGPKEYTCNFDDPVPYVKPAAENGTEVVVPAPSPPAICGTPAVGT